MLITFLLLDCSDVKCLAMEQRILPHLAILMNRVEAKFNGTIKGQGFGASNHRRISSASVLDPESTHNRRPASIPRSVDHTTRVSVLGLAARLGDVLDHVVEAVGRFKKVPGTHL